MTRKQWKALYRTVRIIRRETNKAMTDLMLYGHGYCKVGAEIPDYIQYVPIEDVRL